MLYLKLYDQEGNFAGVDAVESPVYVRQDSRAGMMLRCPKHKAHGVIASDGNTIYRFAEDAPLERSKLRAVKLTLMEYRELT